MLFWAAAVQRQLKLPVFDAATIWGDAADAREGHWQFASAERGHDPIVFDAEAQELLAQDGMDANTIAANGQFIVLRRRANVSAGGTPALVTSGAHPDNQRLAERCARAMGLDIAGVDRIMADIADSWLQSCALVCEVNSQPPLGSSLDAGVPWNAAHMQAMWELVLPQVSQVVAISRQLQAWLPAQRNETAAA